MQLHSADTDPTNNGFAVHVALLGGFRAERAGAPIADVAWQRRSAKRLTKLLATQRSHALHREQIFDILWPEADLDSARNSLAKALHAARHALEPNRGPRQHSSCLRLRDEMVALDSDQVVIDADEFQRLAKTALRLGTAQGYETALAAYTGVLLPEDLYEDWASERRHNLADLHARLLLGSAEALERDGEHRLAVEQLRAALQQDPLREDVHRRLMRLYGTIGERGLAIRQFELCRDLLNRELHVAPDHETEQLYEDLLASRIVPSTTSADLSGGQKGVIGRDGAVEHDAAPVVPFVGRESVLQLLHEQLARAEAGDGGLVVISGEAGVGKTRLATRFALDARRAGALVLGDGSRTSSLPYGPFAAAVERYVAGRPEGERFELARRYQALGCLVPSVESAPPLSLVTDASDAISVRVGTEIARLLADVAATQTVVLVVGDLDEAHPATLGLLEYLATLARHRRWLLIATLPNESMIPGSGPVRLLSLLTYEELCVEVRLQHLEREECDELLHALLPGRALAPDFLDRFYALTDGNPLFVEEFARDIARRKVPPNASVRADDLSPEVVRMPPRVRAVLEKVIAPLGPSARRVLELAAVAGSDVVLDDLQRAAMQLEPPLTTVELFDALDRLLCTRILTDGRDAYGIRHAVVREVLVQDLPRHRRAQLTAALGATTNGPPLSPTAAVPPWAPTHQTELR